MDGYLQTAIGIGVSIVLFWLSYRQTIGAKKERTKNANKSVHRALMKRMVLEDYTPKYKDISRIVEGKSREFNTSTNDMLSEEQILNSVYTEVFDSDLIPPSQRVDIEKRLDTLFISIEDKPSLPSIQEFKLIKDQNRKKRDSLAVLTVTVSTLGAISSLVYSYLRDPSSILSENSSWLLSGAIVFALSIVMLSFLSALRRSKEGDSTISRGSAVISSASFEIEVAKVIEKSGKNYVAEPKIGNFRPDFVIDSENKKIAVEAKDWGDVIPLSVMKRTMKMLENISNEDGIDEVILVTKKETPMKGVISPNSKIRVCSLKTFSSSLRKSA